MVILIFDKSSLLSKNKFIGKQKYFIVCLFFKKVLSARGKRHFCFWALLFCCIWQVL